MSTDQRLARVYLTAVRRPSQGVIRQLVRQHGPVKAAELVASAGNTRRDWELEAIRQLDRGRRRGLRFISPQDRYWPAALQRCPAEDTTPLGLWIRGTAELGALLRHAVVIVGATAATPYGAQTAFGLGCELTAAGWTVLTTGSHGVAGAVHRGGLSVDRPTVAVPLGGLVQPRPLAHSRLFGRVAYRGLLVSESAERPADAAVDLFRQSRLLATVGAAVVLVEPTPDGRTGAVIGLARALGRPLLAVPGPVTSDGSGFAHQLVRDGAARLARDARDVLADLGASCGGQG
jgi:DNA processing protein